MDDYLNIHFQLSHHTQYNLKVTLRKDSYGGICMFSTKPIIKDEIIAYYRVCVYDMKTYMSPTDFTYAFAIFNRAGFPYDHLIGDINNESFMCPIANIPFWGIFANEPNITQSVNAYFDSNCHYNFKSVGRRGYRVGDMLLYKLRALNNIRQNVEILTYYGDDYTRSYHIHITDQDKQKLSQRK